MKTLQTIDRLSASIKKKIKDVEQFASKKNVNIPSIDERYNISRAISEKFPLSRLGNVDVGYGNNNEKIANAIDAIIANKEYHVIKNIGFDSIQKDKIKVRKDSKYYFFQLKEFFGFEDSDFEVIKDQANGLQVVQITNAEALERFINILNYTNPETEAILKAITQEDRDKYKDGLKRKSFNHYYAIHEIAERIGVRSMYTNFKMLTQELSK